MRCKLAIGALAVLLLGMMYRLNFVRVLNAPPTHSADEEVKALHGLRDEGREPQPDPHDDRRKGPHQLLLRA